MSRKIKSRVFEDGIVDLHYKCALASDLLSPGWFHASGCRHWMAGKGEVERRTAI